MPSVAIRTLWSSSRTAIAFCARVLSAMLCKARLAIMACAIAISGPSAASEDIAAKNQAATEKMWIEWTAVLAGCDLGQASYLSLDWMRAATVPEYNDTKWTSRVTGWTGGCRNGKRDGFGILSVRNDMVEVVSGLQKNAEWYDLEGTFVAGKQVGLGCYINAGGEVLSKPLHCTVFGGVGDPGKFRKLMDGRWEVLGFFGQPLRPSAFAASGALENVSERVIAAAKLGRPAGPVQIPVVVDDFGDIVRGGSIVIARRERNPPLQGKRVAIVLSSRTISELERFARMRDDLMKLTSRASTKSPKEREDFMAAFDPSRIVASVVGGIKEHGAIAVPADDLSVLKSGSADYALVFDWRFEGNFALDAKQYAKIPHCEANDGQNKCYELFNQSYSGWLINSAYEAQHYYESVDQPVNLSFHYKKKSYDLFKQLTEYNRFSDNFNVDKGHIRISVSIWLRPHL